MIKKAFVPAIILLASFITVFSSLNSCQTKSSKVADSVALINQNLNDGRILAQKQCNNCHLFVEPKFLDKETWIKHVLPAMAPKLGIAVYGEDQYVNNPNAKSAVTYDDWMKIVSYYEKSAPAKLPVAKPPIQLMHDWSIFQLKKPQLPSQNVATTTLVSIDSGRKSIYTSDATFNTINVWDQQLHTKTFAKLSSPAVYVNYQKEPNLPEKAIFTCIGNMNAVDVAAGSLLSFSINSAVKKADTITKNLPRPVQSATADFNKDGLLDYVVCGFGHNRGGLYLLKQTPDHQFEKTIIRDIAGATHAVVGDYNHDGWPDIMCLFAQAQEGIWLFLNNHHGGFTTQNLIRFLPVFGSTSFQVADFNHDGQPDILYTCGDNSDYSRILKPFHGMYIYINQGNMKFKQSYFYPIDGCTKAMTTDFDGDGDLDIATIAFFSDFKNNPAEGFIYFEQDKPMHFIPHAVPVNKAGRWICMDVNDWNGDGKPDIALGNFSLGFNNIDGFKANWDLKTPVVVLENKAIKQKKY